MDLSVKIWEAQPIIRRLRSVSAHVKLVILDIIAKLLILVH